MAYAIQLLTHTDRGPILLDSQSAQSYAHAMHLARKRANAYGQNTGTIRVLDTARNRVVWTYSRDFGRTFVPVHPATRAEIIAAARACGVHTASAMRKMLEMFGTLPRIYPLP